MCLAAANSLMATTASLRGYTCAGSGCILPVHAVKEWLVFGREALSTSMHFDQISISMHCDQRLELMVACLTVSHIQ